MDINLIRNFSIIAHIDHGKSTLADRLLEMTGAVSAREMRAQLLDSMDIERERGITIKLNNARLDYQALDGRVYELNLIDTPGHVDFSYEVSRSLAACEGALLVVDASQGIEAQTLANVTLARELGLAIIPVINKIDLPAADVNMAQEELLDVLGIDPDTCLLASAKEGLGIREILEAIITRIPPPQQNNRPLQALIFDSYFDEYRGVVVQIRVKEGMLRKGLRIRAMQTGKEHEILELGVKTPAMKPVDSLGAGEVGYVIANIKDIADATVGDTLTSAENPAAEPLPGYQPAKPMVFCGLYPVDGEQFEDLREALAKMRLNDAALQYEPETSTALGFGFRCGFLGLLHMEIVQERLEREHNLNLLATTPSVEVEIVKTNQEIVRIDSPAKLPETSRIECFREPLVKAVIITPQTYTGAIMELCQKRRGVFQDMAYLDKTRVRLNYELPLIEIVIDFFNKLKSATQGYASFDYEFLAFRESDLVKMDILLNGSQVDALAVIVHRDFAQERGRKLCAKLKELIPRHMFEIPIQAALGGKVIARETIRANRKDVTAKCYGGDVTRKRKLLEKQKEGKKRLKSVGNVDIPQDAFLAMLKIEE
ncbi:GTP-binding protein LepA [Candidatus Termititenax persephonae]|uniref:Elongation factor 4 n=1 Tax=Candidatus Termititenax persephonae TaxID=2218525 RepID=A0A388TH57_9BACT|nr:GTP-binding protein LepA [Candidatus Termititenax persephonae]